MTTSCCSPHRPTAGDAVQAAAAARGRRGVRCIGRITSEPGLRLLDAQGRAVPLQLQGFDHFAAGA